MSFCKNHLLIYDLQAVIQHYYYGGHSCTAAANAVVQKRYSYYSGTGSKFLLSTIQLSSAAAPIGSMINQQIAVDQYQIDLLEEFLTHRVYRP